MQFSAEDYHQMNQIQHAIHRVLRPGGSFVFFSFSRPEFLIPKLMMLDEPSIDIHRQIPWVNIEVQQLPKILLYKLQKADDSDNRLKRKRKIKRK